MSSKRLLKTKSKVWVDFFIMFRVPPSRLNLHSLLMIFPPKSRVPDLLPRQKEIYRARQSNVTVCVDRNLKGLRGQEQRAKSQGRPFALSSLPFAFRPADCAEL